MSPKTIWVRADLPGEYEERKSIVSSALEAGFVNIVIRDEDAALKRLGRFEALVARGDDILSGEERIGAVVTISGPGDLSKASAMRDRVKHLIIRARDWKVIPLENLIAEFQGSNTQLMASASTPEEAKLFLETMERGADGIVIEVDDPAALRSFVALDLQGPAKAELTAITVTGIYPLTMGDRVCVDTCSLLRIGEGMLVGSQSSCLFLVGSEAADSEYVASRPFRVNAGAVHSYVLMANGRTKYLSELKGGEEVLAVDGEGATRKAVVGRAKVERRPLLLVEAGESGKRYSTILQNAETIRLCTPDGPVSVSDLEVGQKVLVRLEEGGRHFGHSIKETIMEK
ncbi:MAG: 3-dehydroquinate synthase II [Methanomassiliicoccus sp.]|nr:3-dehydroquinate synthase II [Methanomassiliicoccus sp.]